MIIALKLLIWYFITIYLLYHISINRRGVVLRLAAVSSTGRAATAQLPAPRMTVVVTHYPLLPLSMFLLLPPSARGAAAASNDRVAGETRVRSSKTTVMLFLRDPDRICIRYYYTEPTNEQDTVPEMAGNRGEKKKKNTALQHDNNDFDRTDRRQRREPWDDRGPTADVLSLRHIVIFTTGGRVQWQRHRRRRSRRCSWLIPWTQPRIRRQSGVGDRSNCIPGTALIQFIQYVCITAM